TGRSSGCSAPPCHNGKPRACLTNAAHLRRARIDRRLLRDEVYPQRSSACAGGEHGTGLTEPVSCSNCQGQPATGESILVNCCCSRADCSTIRLSGSYRNPKSGCSCAGSFQRTG